MCYSGVGGKRNIYSPSDHGHATIEPDGTFSYTPPPQLIGTVSFSFRVTDGRGGSVTAMVTIIINPCPATLFKFAGKGTPEPHIAQLF